MRIILSKEEVNVQKVVLLEEDLSKIEEEKYRGVMIRSKAKYTVEGEKCTKFFFNLERSRKKAETIKEIKCKDGRKVKETKEILKEVKDFYEELFKVQGIDDGEKDFILEKVTVAVNKQEKEKCDEKIKIEEIEEAFNQLKGNKSPGIDGITNEFYKAFKDKLMKILKCMMRFLKRERLIKQWEWV